MFAFLSTAAYFIVEILLPFPPCDSVVKILLPAAVRSVGVAVASAFLPAAALMVYGRNPVSFSSGGFTAGILLFFLRVIVLSKSCFLLPS